MRFFCITQPDLHACNHALAAACNRAGIEALMVSPQSYASNPKLIPGPDDLLYRAATDAHSIRLEKLLWQAGVTAFYVDPFFECLDAAVLLQRHGIPMASAADSAPHAMTHRLIIIGDRVVVTEPRTRRVSDRRAATMAAASDHRDEPQADAAALAIKAARIMRVEFAGVDLRRAADGSPLLCALHFPCDFTDLQTHTDVNVAGLMLGHLIAKHRREAAKRKNPYAKLNEGSAHPSSIPRDREPIMVHQWRPSGM